MKITKVIGYLRVSTEGQTDGFGLAAQRKAIRDYCDERDYQVVKWIEDVDSGADFRPGFDEIIYGDVSNPPYEAVVVAKSDRVARDMYIYFYYKGALKRKGIELFSVAEDFGALGQFAHLFEAFTQVCAEIERDNITKRMTAGRLVKAAKGAYAGGRPPYGYRAVGGRLVIDYNEAEMVKEIFRLRKKGLSYEEITTCINEYYVNRQGNPFKRPIIHGIVKSEPIYHGLYRYGNEGEWHKGEHEPILEPYDDIDDEKKKK